MEDKDELEGSDKDSQEDLSGFEVSSGEGLNVDSQKKKKKSLPVILISLVIVGLVVVYTIGGNSSALKSYVNKYILKDYAIRVNSQVIGRAEYDRIYNKEMEMAKEFLKTQHRELDLRGAEAKKLGDEIKKRIVDQLSVRLLLLDDAIKKGYNVSDKDIDAQINGLIEKMGKERFNAILKKDNLTIDYIKDDFKKQMIVQKYLIEKMKQIKIDDNGTEQYFKQNKGKYNYPEMVRASHILLKTEQEAKEILKQLKGGADFAKLAETRSIDPSAKENKGDLNFFPKGAMIPEFEKIAFTYPVGKLSGIVKTQFGYHIIKVTDRKEASDVKFEQVKKAVKGEMVKEKQKNLIDKTINDLKAKAEIDVRV